MRKLLLALAAFLALASCQKNTSADGYYVEKESQRIDVQPVIVLMSSQDQIKRAYANKVHKDLPSDRDLQAFSVIDFKAKTCTIYMIDPKVKYVPEFIGHELTHCIYGEFHPHQNGA